jgi:hypothetical protein
MVFAVFGVALAQPGVEFVVVPLALLAAVGQRVIAQIELPPPAGRAVGDRTMRREPPIRSPSG